MLWSDNGQHFKYKLFLTLMEGFLNNNPCFKVCQNFHERGEGKCDLDRYFGALSARERTFLLNKKDIRGTSFLLNLVLIYLGILDYCTAWNETPNSSFYVIYIDRSNELWLMPDYGQVKKIDYRQLNYDRDNQEFSHRNVKNYTLFFSYLHSLICF